MKITLVKDRSFYRSVLSIMIPVACSRSINMWGQYAGYYDAGFLWGDPAFRFQPATSTTAFTKILCNGIIGGTSVLAQYWGSRGQRAGPGDLFHGSAADGACVPVLLRAYLAVPAQIMSIYTTEAPVIEQG